MRELTQRAAISIFHDSPNIGFQFAECLVVRCEQCERLVLVVQLLREISFFQQSTENCKITALFHDLQEGLSGGNQNRLDAMDQTICSQFVVACEWDTVGGVGEEASVGFREDIHTDRRVFKLRS